MTFDEWLEKKERKILVTLYPLRSKIMNEEAARYHTRQELERNLAEYNAMQEVKRHDQLKSAIAFKKMISEIEELIAKKEQLEAKRDNATDLNKELLLAAIEQIDDQLADSRKEYIRCKSVRDELMQEYKEYCKEVAA